MGRFVLFVAMLGAACEKKEPRYEGLLRLELGDCAADAVWVSGPKPLAPGKFVQRFDDKGDPILVRNEAIESMRESGLLGAEDGGPSPAGDGVLGSDGFGVGGRAGFGPGGMPGRRASVPTVSIGQPSTQGDLDKALIRRYIRRNVAKLQSCYEKQLLAKAALAGTVTATFLITPQGTVGNSQASGVDIELASCVADVIKGIEFPKPNGGGSVMVSYPFTFRPSGNADPAPPQPARPSKPLDLTRYRPGMTNPLRARRLAVEDCLRSNPKLYGAATVKLSWSGTAATKAEVAGVSDEVAACIARAAQTLTRTGGDANSQTCSFAFGEMPPADLPGIDITADAIKLDGVRLADPGAVAKDSGFKIEPLFERIDAAIKRDAAASAPVSIIGPLIVRPLDATPIAVVNKTIDTIVEARGDFVLGASDGPAWRLLSAVEVPVVPVPRETGGHWSAGTRARSGVRMDTRQVQLSILVQRDRIWVGISRVNEVHEVKSTELDKLETLLKERKHSAFFMDRSDVEIAGEEVTYGDVVKVIDLVKKVGFVDFAVTAPTTLSARPQL